MESALGNYLPRRVVARLSERAKAFAQDLEVVQATCLNTDVAGFTGLAEGTELRQLGRIMSRYFDTAFAPVREHGGEIMNLAGDSMLAVWITEPSNVDATHRACLAALDVAKGIWELNRRSPGAGLPTRIGVHCGELLIGSMGAIGHYEYGPLGDPVNTAQRIEQLNKRLGTQVLVSKEALEHARGLPARHVGSFRFAGKKKPVTIYELWHPDQQPDEAVRRLGEPFAAALERFEQGSWEQAAEAFSDLLKATPGDGPSRYFLHLSRSYVRQPPLPPWDGVVPLD
jgi:adenylate cyclase